MRASGVEIERLEFAEAMASPQENPALLSSEPDGRLSGRSEAASLNPIEEANKASNEEFIQRYLKTDSDWTTWAHPTTGAKYTLNLLQAHEVTAEDMKSCFDIIFATSGADYRASAQGWHPAAKKKEMRSSDLRYILVRGADDDGVIKGFVSLMPTLENRVPVVYCYEIHLLPELRQTGLAKRLMGYLMTAAENIPSVEKVVLSYFTSNARAFRFYEKMGFGVDEFSPRERKLRGGRVVTPDYVLLSRRTCRNGHV